MSEGPGSIRVTRRRVLGGTLTIGGAGAAAGAGTMAYFSDSEESTGNSITAGTLNLNVKDPRTFQFSTSLAPTDTTQGSVTLVSDGTLDGSVDVDVTVSNNDGPNASSPTKSPQQVAENLEVISLMYDETSIINQIDSSDSTPTLADLVDNEHDGSEATPNDLINLDDPGSGADFLIELKLKNVSDDFQGEGIDVEFTFYLNQSDDQ